MKFYQYLLLLLFVCTNILNAQKPISLDKSVLSGNGLKKIDLKDEPDKDFYQKNLYWGEELGVFVVSTENWVNKIESYAFDEFIFLYHGESIVKPTIGAAQAFHPGEFFHVPRGFKGEWEIRGGEHLHYELSIISKSRVDSTQVIPGARAKLFDKACLSGNSIVLDEKGYYEEILKAGAELTIKLIGEKPNLREFNNLDKELVIYVLAGQMTLQVESESFVYYTGDAFVLPKGVKGTWQNEGHGLVKYLTIEASF